MTPNIKGSLFMILAMAGFAVEDMFLKCAASRGVPVGLILILFGTGGALIFASLVARQHDPLFPRHALHRAIAAKSAAEILGRLFFTLALAYGTLSATTAILQATPLVVVAGAALLFGEKVGWRRWAAICVGLAGVLVILRPGLDAFTLPSLFAVLGMLGFAGRDLGTRAAPKSLSGAQLGLYGFLVMIPTGAGLLLWQGNIATPTPAGVGFVALGTVFGVCAYAALTNAMRTGEVSVVTPFRYTRLLFGIGFGLLIFGERPDLLTWIGSAVVLSTGLYTMLRERRAKA